ncbi:MAG: chemotaxis protein CheD [Verrucomicrobiota bacterium]
MNVFYNPAFKSDRVEIGGMKVSNDLQAALTSDWLGAGLGLTAYDPGVRVGGMLHSVLADSTLHERAARQRPELFVDTGLPTLLKAMSALGAQLSRVRVCIAGGGQLLNAPAASVPGKGMMAAAVLALGQQGLTVEGQHAATDGDCRLILDVATGEVRAQMSGQDGVMVLWKTSTVS